jgi:hypothetical protein
MQKILEQYRQEKAEWEERYRGSAIHAEMVALQTAIKRTRAIAMRSEAAQDASSDEQKS